VSKIALGLEGDAALADVSLALQERAKKIGIELNF